MTGAARRGIWLAAVALAALGLGGCEAQRGLSGVEAELTRVRAERSFAVVSASAERAVFSVRSRRIVVEPPEGHCLDEESIGVSGGATFALVADCEHKHQVELINGSVAGRSGAAALPRAFPGILTISISGQPAYGPEPGAFDAFEALLGSEAGLGLIGRGVSDQPGRIVATRRIAGALYVLIHEPVDPATSILAPNFWRAFLKVKDRLVLVTVSSFVDRQMAEDTMLGFLAQQMVRLRRGNGLDTDGEEATIAAAMDFRVARAEPVEGTPRPKPRSAHDGSQAPDRAPLPRDRIATAAAGAPTAAATATPATAAPAKAPVAPVRLG